MRIQIVPHFISHHSFLPPIVKLSFSTFQFPGLSFPAHILTAQFSHPESFEKENKNNSFGVILSCILHGTSDSTFCSCSRCFFLYLTCSCSEEVLTSWPALLLYCSLRLSRWTILLTSSSSWLKNFSSRSAGFTGLKKKNRKKSVISYNTLYDHLS